MYTWTARLRDGSIIQESPGISTDVLLRDEVVSFTVVCEGRAVVQLFTDSSNRLVFRRRKTLSLDGLYGETIIVGTASVGPGGDPKISVVIVEEDGTLFYYPSFPDIQLLKDEVPG